jgi:hypothetical protein
MCFLPLFGILFAITASICTIWLLVCNHCQYLHHLALDGRITDSWMIEKGREANDLGVRENMSLFPRMNWVKPRKIPESITNVPAEIWIEHFGRYWQFSPVLLLLLLRDRIARTGRLRAGRPSGRSSSSGSDNNSVFSTSITPSLGLIQPLKHAVAGGGITPLGKVAGGWNCSFTSK